MKKLNTKFLVTLFILFFSIFYAIPALFPNYKSILKFYDAKSIRLGLDLQGGSQLLLKVETEAALNEKLQNFQEDIRRVIWTFSIAYGDDFNKAKSLLLKWIKDDERILNDMEPMVVISELADSSVNIMVRVWVKSENFLSVKFDFNEKVYKEFPKNNLNIPFPQLDVNISK